MCLNFRLPGAFAEPRSPLESPTSLKLPLDNSEQGAVFHCPNRFSLANDYGSLGFPLNLAFPALMNRGVSCYSISLSGIAFLYHFYFTELVFYFNRECMFSSFPITLNFFLLFCSKRRATCMPLSYGIEPNQSLLRLQRVFNYRLRK